MISVYDFNGQKTGDEDPQTLENYNAISSAISL